MGIFFLSLWISVVTTAVGYHDLGKVRVLPPVLLTVGAVAAYVAGVNAPGLPQ